MDVWVSAPNTDAGEFNINQQPVEIYARLTYNGKALHGATLKASVYVTDENGGPSELVQFIILRDDKGTINLET